MRTTALALVCSGMILGWSMDISAASYEAKVGQRHPDFTLPRIDDRSPVSLSDFRGKKVLLIQFSSW